MRVNCDQLVMSTGVFAAAGDFDRLVDAHAPAVTDAHAVAVELLDGDVALLPRDFDAIAMDHDAEEAVA